MPDVDATRARPGLPSSSNLLAAGSQGDDGVGQTFSILSLTVDYGSNGRTGAVEVTYAIDGVLGECAVILGWGDRDVEVQNHLGPVVAEHCDWLVEAAKNAYDACLYDNHYDAERVRSTAFRLAARADFDDTFGDGAFDRASAVLERKRTALRRSAMACGEVVL